MIFYAGPLVLGFILGFIVGSRVKINPESKLNFTWGSYITIFIAALVAAYFLGPFPYYEDIPLASGFLAGIVGIIVGIVTLGRYGREQTEQ